MYNRRKIGVLINVEQQETILNLYEYLIREKTIFFSYNDDSIIKKYYHFFFTYFYHLRLCGLTAMSSKFEQKAKCDDILDV